MEVNLCVCVCVQDSTLSNIYIYFIDSHIKVCLSGQMEELVFA